MPEDGSDFPVASNVSQLTGRIRISISIISPALACVVAVHSLGAQTGVDIIRGRVTADGGRPISGASAIVTMAPNRETFRTDTDSTGHYSISIRGGTGDYLVHLSSIGRETFRKRVTRESPDQMQFVVDAQLDSAVQELATIQVTGARERPERGLPAGIEVGAAERTVDGIVGALAPHQRGDLSAMLQTIPGVHLTANGVAVLSLDPTQNRISLNGLGVVDAEMPREARSRTRLFTSTYDPARGGFSGAEAVIEIPPGNVFEFRRSHLTIDRPGLQYSDRITSEIGPRPTRVMLGLGGDGELVPNRFYYNAAGEFRRESDLTTNLLGASRAVLELVGASPDSVARFAGLLLDSGIPSEAVASQRTTTTDSRVLVRIDYKPFETAFFNKSKATWGILAYGKVAKAGPSGLSPLRTPSQATGYRRSSAILQGIHSVYWGRNFLTDTRTSISTDWRKRSPVSRLPEARVLLQSKPDDDLASVWVEAGGNQIAESNSRKAFWETTSTTRFHTTLFSGSHQLNLHFGSRLAEHDPGPTNGIASFSYLSLADFEQAKPVSFYRTMPVESLRARTWNGVVALGDSWRYSQSLSVLYGLRLDAEYFLSQPNRNSRLEDAFGARNDHTPQTIALSPRIGFKWTYLKGRENNDKMSTSRLATIYQGPRGTFSGGFGAFRNEQSAELLSAALSYSGLNASRRLYCIGSAVPEPLWPRYVEDLQAIPASCRSSASQSPDSARSVQLFSRSFHSPVSWRSNLSWSLAARHFDLSLEGIYSFNLNQPGRLDLNFSGVPRFSLENEGGRKVYSAADDIDPFTGILRMPARKDQYFADVLENTSSNRSISRQLVVVLTPALPTGKYFVRAAYSFSSHRESRTGFDGTALGDPRLAVWSRTKGATDHQFHFHAGVANRWISLTTFSIFNSGLRYTPVVSGDINGDGSSLNDRAFVFDPAVTEDPQVAIPLSKLLREAPSAARECLRTHLGRAVEQNKCRGPWTAQMNAELALSKDLVGRIFGTGNRMRVALNLTNPLGGLDHLMHGSAPRGWGSPFEVNPILYRVRGFDPGSKQFIYEVNPQFGQRSANIAALRTPFRITLDISADIGRSVGEQQLNKWLKPGRAGRPGVRLSADSLKRRYERNIPNIYGYVLIQGDSLLLSPQQTVLLRKGMAAFRAQMDSLWIDLSVHMAALPDDYSGSKALDRQERAIELAWELAWRESKNLKNILSPVQLRLLPWPVSMLHSADKPPKGFRLFMAG